MTQKKKTWYRTLFSRFKARHGYKPAPHKQRRRRMFAESLEQRQLLAGDLGQSLLEQVAIQGVSSSVSQQTIGDFGSEGLARDIDFHLLNVANNSDGNLIHHFGIVNDTFEDNGVGSHLIAFTQQGAIITQGDRDISIFNDGLYNEPIYVAVMSDLAATQLQLDDGDVTGPAPGTVSVSYRLSASASGQPTVNTLFGERIQNTFQTVSQMAASSGAQITNSLGIRKSVVSISEIPEITTVSDVLGPPTSNS